MNEADIIIVAAAIVDVGALVAGVTANPHTARPKTLRPPWLARALSLRSPARFVHHTQTFRGEPGSTPIASRPAGVSRTFL